MTASLELLLIHAAGNGELTYADDNPYGFAWQGRHVDSTLGNRLDSLVNDGLIDYDETDGAPVKATDAGWGLFR